MNTKKICLISLGIALYVTSSLILKIPIIAHISLDLGYIFFAIYCYYFGPISGAIVGGVGCMLISVLTSGWFPPGWIVGNVAIGLICGSVFSKTKRYTGKNANVKVIILEIVTVIVSVFFGIEFIKTFIECALYGMPIQVKLISNGIAAITDSIVMCIGVFMAHAFKRFIKIQEE